MKYKDFLKFLNANENKFANDMDISLESTKKKKNQSDEFYFKVYKDDLMKIVIGQYV